MNLSDNVFKFYSAEKESIIVRFFPLAPKHTGRPNLLEQLFEKYFKLRAEMANAAAM